MSSKFVEENDPRYREDVSVQYFVSVAAGIAEIVKSGKAVENVDSKLFYKLRHNLLKTICLRALDLDVTQEKPFSFYQELELDSSRTPDYLQKAGEYFFLIEFTVSSSEKSILTNKEYFTKYNQEIRNSAVPIKDYYIYYTLDGDISEAYRTTKTVADNFGLPLSDTFYDELEDMFETVKAVTAYFQDFAPEVLVNNYDETTIDLKSTKLKSKHRIPYSEMLVGKQANKAVRVRSLLISQARNLLRQARSRSTFSNYRIRVNFVTGKCYPYENENGVSKGELVNLLDCQSDKIASLVDVIGDHYTERGVFNNVKPYTAGVDLDSRRQNKVKKFDVDGYENRLFAACLNQPMKTVTDFNLELKYKEVGNIYLKQFEMLLQSQKTTDYRSSPFIFYPCDTLVKGCFSMELETRSPIVNRALSLMQGYNSTSNKLIDREINYDRFIQYNRLNSQLGPPLKMKYRSDFKKFRYMSNSKFEKAFKEDPSLADIAEFRRIMSEYRDIIMENTRKMYSNRFRMNLKTNDLWNSETEHFRRKPEGCDVYPRVDSHRLLGEYRSMMSELFLPIDEPVVDRVLSDTKPLGGTLADMCSDMYSDLKEVEDIFRHTRLAHSINLTSQLCYTLSYYSNIKLNKDDFVYDNLGYNNVLLLVKGGKKVISTRTSRFFRILMPITESQSVLIDSSTNQIYRSQGKLYLLTPWRMLRLPYLKKGMELYHNFGNYFISSYKESGLELDHFKQFISIKVLLLFSQKRKMEVWSSILRYLYFNSLGSYSDVESLVPDMVMLPVDSLSYLLQTQFMNNYHKIFEGMRQGLLYDIFWEVTHDNMDLTVERFEENIFMSKAPFNPVNEHLGNLKSVLDTHRYFLNHVGSYDKENVLEKTKVEIGEDYFIRLESNDFNFDPNVCLIVGDYAAKMLSTSKSKSELQELFNNYIGRTYTEIATGKGMRDQDGVFWGKKGHDVVNQRLAKRIDAEETIDKFPMTASEFKRMISSTNVSFKDMIESLTDPILEFDMKDKVQYKGSREIYVMTEVTKLLQNPIEKFFGAICRCFPNELIHKPSGTRPKYIHSKIFEQDYDRDYVMYCTMDCRKWAPRSNLWKYYYFIKGMKAALPKTFYDYFMKFWHLMFNKRIRIQSHYVELLKTNEGYSDIEELLRKREDGDYELIMPYSFMMGIFNYLSSLMHAASQMFFSDRFAERLGVTCNFIAHSDDSGGIIVARNREKAVRAFTVYEKFQRTLNHMMSRKKCVLSELGFEMISIMYNNKRFIPMTHKFLSNVALDLMAAGWYKDVCTIVGKVVDLFNNGGTYLQCYSLMLSMSEMLRKAYHLPRHEYLSHVPLPLGGIFNLHPVHMVLLGSKCHEGLLDVVETPEQRCSRIKHYLALCGDYNTGSTGQLQYHVPYFRLSSSMLDIDSEQIDKLSAIATLPIKSSLMDHLRHHSRLFEQSYRYSLSGVDNTQLLLATLFYPCSVKLTDDKLVNMKSIVKLYLGTYLIALDEVSDIPIPIGQHHSYLRQAEKIKFDYKKQTIVSNKSCKPLRYSAIDNFNLRISQENMMYLSAFEKWPDLKKVVTAPERFDVLKDYLLRTMPGKDEDKIKFLKNFDPSEKEDKNRTAYLFMPSGVNVNAPQRFFTYSLLYCTRRYTISSQKPQLYTPEEFNIEGLYNRDYKHQYLMYKLIERSPSDSLRLLEHYRSCKSCKWAGIGELKIYAEYLTYEEMSDFACQLPFVDYITSQIRGRNVWFSDCDFNLYYMNSRVESRQVDGEIVTRWIVEDPSVLGPLWDYYRIFCNSRGIRHATPVNELTGFDKPRLAFNDFNTPYVPQLGSIAMVLPNSSVLTAESVPPKVHRKGNKFYVNDRVVDFKIQHIYDINETFYNNHNLSSIKDLVVESGVEVEAEVLKRYFSESKLYSVLLQDERHSSYNSKKYTRNGLLGSPGSFTRALALSDERGVTKYRSSHNPAYHTKGAIEYDRVEGVPVLDMFEKISFSRITAMEMVSFERVMSGKFLTGQDKENLKRIRSKMGLESLGLSIEAYKHVFRGMSAGTLMKMPSGVVSDLLKLLMEALANCMLESPASNNQDQYTGSRKSFWCHLRTILTLDDFEWPLSLLLARGLLRAKLDNQHKFWSYIRDDVLLSCLSINRDYIGNLNSFIRGMLKAVNKDGNVIEVFYESGRPNFRALALAKCIELEEEEDEPEVVSTFRMGSSEEAFLADEDYLDCYCQKEEDDYDEELEERVWLEGSDSDEDSDDDIVEHLKVCCYSLDSLKLVMERTGLNDYKSISISCPYMYISFPWLGYGNFTMKRLDGVDYYVSEFPGRQPMPEQKFFNVRDLQVSKPIEILDNEEDDSILEDTELKYAPNTVRDKKLAERTLHAQGLMIPGMLQKLMPGEGMTLKDVIEDTMKTFNQFPGLGIPELINRRGYTKFHLPGFQGILQDEVLSGELRALFGDNANHILTGNVRVSNATYNQTMKAILRMFNKSDVQDRALMLLLIAILVDTIPGSDSDSWFCDRMNEMIDEIDNRVYGEDDTVILPVNPTQGHLVYKERPVFD